MDTTHYDNPLNQYASSEMKHNFSPIRTYTLWRKLWLVLAQSQQKLGLEIPNQAIEEMKANLSNIDFERVKAIERDLKHDVMAHLHEFGEKCPTAKPILHLGATSVYIKDNAELIMMKEGLLMIQKKLKNVLELFKTFINEHKNLACLGFTHFQSAQLVTVGKRAVLWAQSLLYDLEQVNDLLNWLPFRGVKGTVGSGDSFEKLFHNYDLFIALDEMIRKEFGFQKSLMTGQVYDRKIDSRVLSVLSQIAQSAHKFSNDVRLLQGLKEMEEPFGSKQIGSSAMAYKRNPVLCERMSGLCKFVFSLSHSSEMVAATQWLERTLDDSSNRRLTISQAFLSVDSILDLFITILKGLKVYPKVIEAHINEELPFIITEKILMESVKKGLDRQEVHEKIRQYAMESVKKSREEGISSYFLEAIAKDGDLKLDQTDLESMKDFTQFTGFCANQCEDFIKVLDSYL